MKRTGYLAPEGLENALLGELKNVEQQLGRLIIALGEEQEVYWVQNIWRNLQIIAFDSIGDGAKKLRSLQGLWALYPYENIRSAKFIQEKLAYFASKPLPFPARLPKASLGSWTLLDANTLIASANCSSVLPHGEYHFQETKEPPSRAYLKLWEVFTRLECIPQPGDLCLELGASPGSWTWVLSQLGAKVIAVDKAPLAKDFPNVQFLKKDAFQLQPSDFIPKIIQESILDGIESCQKSTTAGFVNAPVLVNTGAFTIVDFGRFEPAQNRFLTHFRYSAVKWVFSDLICYPEKLLSWV